MKTFLKYKKIFIALIFLLLVFLFGNSSFMALMHNSFTIRRLTKKAALLDEQYKQLNEEYQQILSGKTNYIEDNARVKYNMAKPEEIEFRIKK